MQSGVSDWWMNSELEFWQRYSILAFPLTACPDLSLLCNIMSNSLTVFKHKYTVTSPHMEASWTAFSCVILLQKILPSLFVFE